MLPHAIILIQSGGKSSISQSKFRGGGVCACCAPSGSTSEFAYQSYCVPGRSIYDHIFVNDRHYSVQFYYCNLQARGGGGGGTSIIEGGRDVPLDRV